MSFVAANRHLKDRAYAEVAKARRDGSFPLRQPCVIRRCNRPGVAHHEDYAKPLEVVWLCRLHHSWRHKDGDTVEQMDALGDAA